MPKIGIALALAGLALAAGAAHAQESLLRNGSFQAGLEGWETAGKVSVIRTAGPEGRRCALIRRSAADDEPVWWGLQQRFPVEAGAPYRVSFRLRQENGQGVHAKLLWQDAAGKDLGTAWLRPGADGTTGWERVAAEATAPEGARQARLSLWCWCPKREEGRVWLGDARCVSRAMRHVSGEGAARFVADGGKPRVLFVGFGQFVGGGVLPSLDPTYRRRLYARGYTADACSLKDLRAAGPGGLRHCNVVTLTQFAVDELPFAPDAMLTLRRFVEEGGGLLVMGGTSGYGDYAALVGNLNELLAPFDARLLFEEVADPERNEVYDKGILTFDYCWTENVLAGHPATRGIRRLWYPRGGGQHAAGYATCTLATGPDWSILARGSRTARSQTYPSEPPLVAARDYRTGRVALAPFDPRYSINEGYHPAYGGYVEKGDLSCFLCQLYDWLEEPSIHAGSVYREAFEELPAAQPRPAAPSPEPPDADARTLAAKAAGAPRLPIWRGVIGLHSDLSDGAAPVEEYCREARALGYHFVVFAEDYSKMDEARWAQLGERCRKESGDAFLALPGLQIAAPDGERIAFHLARFPNAAETDGGPQLLFNQGWPAVILSQPGRNRLTAWQNKFYTGLALFTYERGRLVDDATALYRRLSASDYRLIPVAVNKAYSLADLRATRGQAVTWVHARSLAELAEHPDWQHAGALRTMYGCGTSHTSSGPVLERFAVATGAGALSYAGAYESYPGHRELVTLSVRSQAPLKEVLLYKGDRLYRRFLPNERQFATQVASTSDRNDAPFSLFARDARGGVLQSNALRSPYNPSFCYTMCVDKQNSILVAGGIGMTAGWIAGYDTGALFPPMLAEGIVPSGEDASWCPISSVEMRPDFGPGEEALRRLAEPGPDRDPLAFASRRCLLSTPDCLVTEEHYEQGFVSARIRTTSLPPRPGGISAMVVEQRIRVQREVPLRQPWVTLLRLMTNTALNLYPRCTWQGSDGRMGSAAVDTKSAVAGTRVLRSMALGPGGHVGIYGSPVGAVAVYPLSGPRVDGVIGLTDQTLHAFVSGRRQSRNLLEMRLPVAGKHVRAGTEWRTAFLVVVDCRSSPRRTRLGWQPRSLANLARAYALAGGAPPGVSVSLGSRDPSRAVPLTVNAEDGGAVVTLAAEAGPMGLPVAIRGLNPHWDAVVYLGGAGKLRRLGVAGTGEGCALLDGVARGPAYLGHPVVCDRRDVRVRVDLERPGALRVSLHNPTDRAIVATVRRARGFHGCSDFRRKVVLAPGQTASLAVGRGRR